MSDPDIEVQRAIRARLVATAGVTNLVPAGSIIDSHERPAPRPAIILGESQVLEQNDIQRRRYVVFHTVHVWMAEGSLEGCKAICNAVRTALKAGRMPLTADLHMGDVAVRSVRLIRDPDGETSHGVISAEFLVCEVPE